MFDQWTSNTWNDERVALLKKLVDDGLSAGQIAAKFGCGLSRSAIIGKIDRLGLHLANAKGKHGTQTNGVRAAVTRKRHSVSGPGQNAHTARRVAASEAPKMPVTEPVELPPEDPASAVSFFDLDNTPHAPKHCRWPVADVCQLDAPAFCGDTPTTDKPYCERHCRMAYVKPRTSAPRTIRDRVSRQFAG